MRVPDLPVQRAPVIKLLLEREHAVHDTCEIARRAVDAHLHSSDGTRGRRLEAAPSEEAHDTDTQLVGGHRQRRTCPNTCMYAEGRPDTECEDELYAHSHFAWTAAGRVQTLV